MAIDSSTKAVYDYIPLANNGCGMVSDITLKSQKIVVVDTNYNNSPVIFCSDVVIETKYGTDVLIVTIMDDQII
jgi:hypothetical protein